MRALGLFVTLVAAHAAMLSGRDVVLSLWSLPAYLWQDAAVALAFGLYDRALRRPLAVWPVYGLLVVWAALNAVVASVLPTPLTPAMLRAARGTLSDSIASYLTVPNLALCGAILALGGVLPFMLRRLAGGADSADDADSADGGGRRRGGVFRRPGLSAAIAAVLVAAGPYAASRIDTGGLHRNAFGTLLPARTPRAADAPGVDWRLSPDGAKQGPDLSRFRGIAAGRHVVLIMLESVGAAYLAPYGAAEDPMPNVSRLTAGALIFEHAYAAYPESVKGFYSVLCSRHPALRVSAEAHAAAECRSLADELKADGYSTALFHSGRFDYLGMRALVEHRGFDTLADAGTLTGRHDSSFGVDEPATVAAMLGWIDALPPDRLFLLAYLPVAGHHPYATLAPGPFPADDERNRYRNAIHEADRAIGELLSELERRELTDETLFVLFGDHGEAFGERPRNIGHSFFLYEENLHVPFLIAAPGRIDGQVRADRVISLVDTVPTVLDLLGRPLPAEHEGVSLLDGPRRMALFMTDYASGLVGLRDGCRKLIHDVDLHRTELFDLCRDPGERADRSTEEPERVAVYVERLEAWAVAQRAAVLGAAGR